jgi:hypothetical protein
MRAFTGTLVKKTVRDQMDPMTEGMSSYIALAWTKILISVNTAHSRNELRIWISQQNWLFIRYLACESGDQVVWFLKGTNEVKNSYKCTFKISADRSKRSSTGQTFVLGGVKKARLAQIGPVPHTLSTYAPSWTRILEHFREMGDNKQKN